MSRSVGSILGSAHIMKQVYFPRAIIPLAAVLVSLVDLAVSSVMLVVVELATNRTFHLSAIAVLPLYFGLVLLMAGLGIFLGVIGGLVRDIRFALPLLLQVVFIISPVMYPQALVPRRLNWLYDGNPLTHLLGGIREAVVAGHWPSAALLCGLPAAALALLTLSLLYCASIERRLPDYL